MTDCAICEVKFDHHVCESCVDSVMNCHRTPESNVARERGFRILGIAVFLAFAKCSAQRTLLNPDKEYSGMLLIYKMFRPTDLVWTEIFALTNADKCDEFHIGIPVHNSHGLLRSNLKCTKGMCNPFCGAGSAKNRSISVSCTSTRYYFVTPVCTNSVVF